MKPDKKDLTECISLMAEAMKFNPLPNHRVNQLIEHVLYEREYDDIEGKEGWITFSKGLTTEREIRDLFMAHTATKIARHNKKEEPSCTEYSTKELRQKFELALLGKIIAP